jgi:hypothetical protein
MLTAGPRNQFARWSRSRRRLSVCSILWFPDLWFQCSVSFVHGLEKTLFLCDASFFKLSVGTAMVDWRDSKGIGVHFQEGKRALLHTVQNDFGGPPSLLFNVYNTLFFPAKAEGAWGWQLTTFI